MRLVNHLTVLILSLSPAVCAHAEDTFKAQAMLTLCPEFKAGGAQVQLQYSVGTDSNTLSLTPISSSLSSATNTGTFQFKLPNTFGTTPLYVSAVCKNKGGTSDPSNKVAITNCDALALLDTDGDSLKDNEEDTNCSNAADSEDNSNYLLYDSDGDGSSDRDEKTHGTNPRSAISSTTPTVQVAGIFDPDGDGNSNPVSFRPSDARWSIGDVPNSGNTQSFIFPSDATAGDLPFTYRSPSIPDDVGVVRTLTSSLEWEFNGLGFLKSGNIRAKKIEFGIPGDIITPGPWESANITSPAVARRNGDGWRIIYYKANGLTSEVLLPSTNGTPVPADYDGDGKFDAGAYDFSSHTFVVRLSSNGIQSSYLFGDEGYTMFLKGDVTGDGKADVSLFNPSENKFIVMKSNIGFDAAKASAHLQPYFDSMVIQGSFTLAPVSFYRSATDAKVLLMGVDHSSGIRAFKNNNGIGAVQTFTHGGSGEAQG